MRITVLGCGSSNGVPYIGNRWGKCDPTNPRNRRRRPSVLVEADGQTILIDTTPDLREQMLDADVRRLDAVLWTHPHADHLHGLDDLREVCRLMERSLPGYALPEHMGEITSRFAYAFMPLPAGHSFYRPQIEMHPIHGPFRIGSLEVRPFRQDHGWLTTVGFRIGDFAYSTDVVRLDDKAFAELEGVKVWIVDCVQEEEHPVHSHLPQTLGWIERVKPERAFLTHMSAHLDYEATLRKLPPHVEPAYDGLVIEL
jgi:phosphoribosyl 1,2-cyclic phosphate phosphodiesterase